jgi:isoleucyl-tRNA synthetase
VLVERLGREGYAVASADGVTVALDTTLDDELLLEGRVRNLIRRVNSMRKEQGLELTDRIVLTLPADLEPLLRWEEHIKSEVLAVEIRVDGDAGLSIAKA